MVNSSEFSERLQKILEYYGLSATAFSEEIAFNRSTISHLLSGRNKPSLEFVMKVIQTFPEIELYWLLNGKGSFPSTSKKQQSPSIGKPIVQNSPTNQATSTPVLSKKIQEQSKTIDRIVVFYSDGTFNAYKNEED